MGPWYHGDPKKDHSPDSLPFLYSRSETQRPSVAQLNDLRQKWSKGSKPHM